MDLERVSALGTSRVTVLERRIDALTDSLHFVQEELATARAELTAAVARTYALEGQVGDLRQSLTALRHGSLFGNSGFYVGVGSGAGIVTGTMRNVGYGTGLNVTVPIGWSKAGVPLGVRTEWAMQSFEGRLGKGFANPDPMVFSGTAMLTLNLPLNQARTHQFYLMGGGGAYMFRDIGLASALNDRFDGAETRVTKWGVTGGAGLELHVLGATALFVEVPFTNVFADESAIGAPGGRNLRWMGVVAGVTLR
jgi:hypothetical protein